MSVPAEVQHVAARDGTPLVVRHWAVGSGEPWASLLLVHGLAEHAGRYEHVGGQLAEAGIDAYALDLRGFGASGGPRASVERWSQLHDDLEERVVAIRSMAPGLPLVLYGHSLGGLILLGYALDGRSRPDLLVLSAPSIAANVPRWQRVLVASLRRIAPGLLIANRIDPDVLSSDAEVGKRYVTDPLMQHRTTAGFAHGGFAEQRRVVAALDRLSIQALVIHGGLDQLVPTETSAALEGRPGVTRRVYADLRHELHNEPDGPRVINDVIAWIRERASRIAAHGPRS